MTAKGHVARFKRLVRKEHVTEAGSTQLRIDKAKECLDVFDTDKNGTIDRDEFKAILTRHTAKRLGLSAGEADTLFGYLDLNKDGVLDTSEVAAALGSGTLPALNDIALVGKTQLARAKTLAALRPLDDGFAKVLADRDVLLLDADWLRKTDLKKMPYRQELEECHPEAFASAESAVALLRAGGREIGAVTYGWGSKAHPDPEGGLLRNLQAALKHPSCAHVEAFFWDYASLYQHPDFAAGVMKTAEQKASFDRALGQMAHVYASVVGTTVVRHEAVPPCEGGNPKQYYERGWPNFETAVAEEGLARVAFQPELAAELAQLPPKLLEIGDGAPRPVAIAAAEEGAGPRIEANIKKIEGATFTGKGEAPVVVGLYRRFVTSINNAVGKAGGATMDGEYEGEYDAAGRAEGWGTIRFADGDVYEGEWKADEKEGRGTYRYVSGNVYEGEFKTGEKEGRGTCRYADGDVYDGEYKAGKKEGRGTYRYADGEAEVGRYRAGKDVGEAARWSADRQTAWRVQDGKRGENISLEEAKRIADEIGLPVPA